MFIASSPGPSRAVCRFCFSTGQAATRPTCCRSAARLRREPRSSRLAGTSSKAICRVSSVASARACSTRTTSAAGQARLANFVAEARGAYGLARPFALGYSNGANIAAAVLQLHPKTLAGAILFRAMAPLAEPPTPDLSGIAVLILSGLNDPIAPRSTAEKLAAALAAAGARVERDDLPTGHGLTQADVTKAKAFYAREAARAFNSKA